MIIRVCYCFRPSKVCYSLYCNKLSVHNIIHTFMYVLVTYRDEENQMKNEGARVVTTLYSYILDAQGQLTL